MATQHSRILIKRSTVTTVVPTVPASNDHLDGTWLSTDIYKGEYFVNIKDDKVWTRTDSGIVQIYPAPAGTDLTGTQIDQRITRGNGTDTVESSAWFINDVGVMYPSTDGLDIGITGTNRIGQAWMQELRVEATGSSSATSLALLKNSSGNTICHIRGDGSFSLGINAVPADNDSAVIGVNAGSTSGTIGTDFVCIGPSAGAGTENIGSNSVQVGRLTKSTGTDSTAIGSSTKAVTQATALGRQCDAQNQSNIAIGDVVVTSSNDAHAYGRNLVASGNGSIYMGHHSTTTTNSTADSFGLVWDATTPTMLLAKTADSYLNGSGGIAVYGTAVTNSSCAMEFLSTTRVPVMPTLTTTQRNALTAVNGMIIYNSTTTLAEMYINGAWTSI
jgi:hypothetical protein